MHPAQEEQAQRRHRLQQWLQAQGADAALLTSRPALRYLAGWRSEHAHERLTALLLPARRDPVLLVPALDAPAAAHLGLEVEAWPDGQDPFSVLAGCARRLGIPARRWAVEKDHLSLRAAERLREALETSPELLDAGPVLADMRLRKSEAEVAALERAAAVLEQALAQVRPLIRPGLTELELAGRLRQALLAAGAEGVSFEPLVLSGPQSALPHGFPSTREVGAGELVLVDAGAVVDGYCSDITRTFAAGRYPPDAARVYQVVLQAQQAALAAVRPGALPGEVDAAARRVIEEAGYGAYFPHRTGHGLGLDIHEPPWLHAGYHQPLQPGMVLTVEPGIYLPGRFGIRVEDMVLVTEEGYRLLTRFPRRWEELEG